MSLRARVDVRLGDFRLDVELGAEPGELVVLVGPNGAGKTTFLRALAGLETLSSGHVSVDGVVLDDAADSWTPPHKRSVGLVPQRDHLLPHLSALGNVAFGLRRRGASRRDADVEARRWLGVVGLEELADRSPEHLSGGESKRVALARALAVRPRLLLLDEPFAALDASARRDIRRELRSYLEEHDGVRIMVTHEPVDALALADRIVVLEGGRIVQDVSPEEIRVRPRSDYVAEFVGVNLFTGTADGDRILTASGAEIVAASSIVSGRVLAVIHPRAVALHLQPPEGSPRNTWFGTVNDVDDEGSRVRARVDGDLRLVAEITKTSADAMQIRRGREVYATVKATEIDVYQV